VISDRGFLKGDPDFKFVQTTLFSILKGLDVVGLSLFGWDFPIIRRTIGVLGQMMALHCAKLRLLSHSA